MCLRRGRSTARTTASAMIAGDGRFSIAAFIRVATNPGSMSVTAIPSLRSSRRTESFKPRNPNFEAEYIPITPDSPAIEPMLTIDPPPCARITGITACIVRAGPSRLTASTCSSSSSPLSISEGAEPIPAAFTSTSIRPNARTAAATSASTSARFVMSAGTTRTRSPNGASSAASASSSASPSAARTTRIPRAKNARTVAAPIPPDAPTTTATRCERFTKRVVMGPSRQALPDGADRLRRLGTVEGAVPFRDVGDGLVHPVARDRVRVGERLISHRFGTLVLRPRLREGEEVPLLRREAVDALVRLPGQRTLQRAVADHDAAEIGDRLARDELSLIMHVADRDGPVELPDHALRAGVELTQIGRRPPVAHVAVQVELVSLVVEPVRHLVSDRPAARRREVRRVVAARVEERTLELRRRQDDLVALDVVVRVDRLRRHAPLRAVQRLPDLPDLIRAIEDVP